METIDYSKKTISQLAFAIEADWNKGGKRVHPYALPYLEAMGCLNKISDNYGADTGESVVAYFLGNAKTWKGETAKEIKKELNKRLKAA